MPQLATALGAVFGAFFSILAKRLTLGVAAAGAFLACAAAAFAIAKVALFALFATLSLVAPSNVVIGLSDFMPSHVTTYIGLILLAQTIMVAFDYWKVNLQVAYQLANAT